MEINIQYGHRSGAKLLSKAERLRLPEGPDAMSPEEWLDFQKARPGNGPFHTTTTVQPLIFGSKYHRNSCGEHSAPTAV
eukprot:6467457-Amphidinium_carterae.1